MITPTNVRGQRTKCPGNGNAAATDSFQSSRARKDRAPRPSLDGGGRPALNQRKRAPAAARREVHKPLGGLKFPALPIAPSFPAVPVGKFRSAHILYRAITHRAETFEASDDHLLLQSHFDDLEFLVGFIMVATVGVLAAIRLAVGA
jgi:hypothetical protein